ncbi:MAG: outer membrane protein assembly factor BamB [Xanthomonadaceae bacterium]|nr:outer membrane protein assembly factor BamB [Xanthomonadaceae bacterium]
MKHWLWYFVSLMLLGGCALRGKDTSEPPTPLTSIEQQVELETVWERRAGSGHDKQFVSLRPAFVGGQVYLADRKGRVYALNTEDGEPLWDVNTRAPISAGVDAGEGLVVMGTSDGEVLALDMRDGAEVWRARVASEVLAVPRIDRGVVVVQSADGTLTGLDAASGERRWAFDRTMPALTLRGSSTPALAGGAVLAGFANGRLALLGVEQGRTAWELAIAEPRGRSELERMVDLDADPVIDGVTAYAVSYQGQVAAVDMRAGQIDWRRDMSAYAGLGVDFSQLYVTDDQSQVWGLSRRDGAALWKQDALRLRDLTAPVPFGDLVAVGDYEGYVHLLSRIDGDLVGRLRTDGRGIARLQAVGERLYVLGKRGLLTVLQVQSPDR